MLILVRHGRTEANAQARLQGRLDLPLDEVGQRQAASIAERLGAPDVLIASPLLRARQTAEHFGTDITIDDRWVEISYGAYEGLPFEEVASETWDRWHGDIHFCPPDGESLFTLGERVVEACESLLTLARDRDGCRPEHLVAQPSRSRLGVPGEVHAPRAQSGELQRTPVVTGFRRRRSTLRHPITTS
jgi:broad specificity phosphatase PhoE